MTTLLMEEDFKPWKHFYIKDDVRFMKTILAKSQKQYWGRTGATEE